jgi:hypothetical protein
MPCPLFGSTRAPSRARVIRICHLLTAVHVNCCFPGNDTCTSDASCAAGQVCSKDSPVQKCQCKAADGTDSCEFRGVCRNFCVTQEPYITTANNLVPTCTSVFDMSCGQGASRTAS